MEDLSARDLLLAEIAQRKRWAENARKSAQAARDEADILEDRAATYDQQADGIKAFIEALDADVNRSEFRHPNLGVAELNKAGPPPEAYK